MHFGHQPHRPLYPHLLTWTELLTWLRSVREVLGSRFSFSLRFLVIVVMRPLFLQTSCHSELWRLPLSLRSIPLFRASIVVPVTRRRRTYQPPTHQTPPSRLSIVISWQTPSAPVIIMLLCPVVFDRSISGGNVEHLDWTHLDIQCCM